MIEKALHRPVRSLLAQLGWHGDFALHPLKKGANNRVYRVRWKNNDAFLKVYFRHLDDPRDRQGTEFAFSQYAWASGVRMVPRPLACDPRHQMNLFEYIHGKPLKAGHITRRDLTQFFSFFQALNKHQGSRLVRKLRPASEACFSLDEHLRCVDRRVQALQRISRSNGLRRAAASFVEKDLAPTWESVRVWVLSEVKRYGLSSSLKLRLSDRRLSPSDFGFHNALRTAGGRLRFYDFEYAGWDDPAKTACDFASQPRIHIPPVYAKWFTDRVVSRLSDPHGFRERIRLLMPVYKIKWCCIMLNDFLPVGHKKRLFAGRTKKLQSRMRRQLTKARQALENLSIKG